MDSLQRLSKRLNWTIGIGAPLLVITFIFALHSNRNINKLTPKSEAIKMFQRHREQVAHDTDSLIRYHLGSRADSTAVSED